MKITHKVLFASLLLLYSTTSSNAQAPPLREQVSLNGTWKFTPQNEPSTTITVPEYWDAAPGFIKKVEREFVRDGKTIKREVNVPSTSIATYEREIMVSEAWKDKVIKVEFEGVNHIAEVYVNDIHLSTHLGGWTPFSVDVTDMVEPGDTFNLKVIVKGGDQEPIVDAEGNPQWPVGWSGHQSRWGIIFDVWLRAYGKVYIQDTYIQTSWRNKEIITRYEVFNTTDKDHTFRIFGKVRGDSDNEVAINLASELLKIGPGQRQVVSITEKWENPRPWNPETPNLYILTSGILLRDNESNPVIDQESRRFGFREIWIEGNELRFNGHRLNLRGTSINTHGQGYNRGRYDFITPETWNRTIDRLQYLNISCVRFHQQPPSKRIIEIADERGLLVIEESPMYARRYILDCNNEIYFNNGLKWLVPWVKDRRNNPSVIMWSSENEIGRNWLRWFSDKQLKTLADTIRRHDPTRPVIAEGDLDIDDDFFSLHYPEGVGKTVTGSIYSWDTLVSKEKPTGIGEFLFGRTDGKEWWHGTWCRGLRYVNVDQIMPYTLKWSWVVDSTTAVYENLKRSFSPVALFDKEYDDLGIEVLRNGEYPSFKEGEKLTRHLVLYNDDFSGSIIDIEVRLVADGKMIKNDISTINLPLGEHIDIDVDVQVPDVETDILDVVLLARKKGKLRFEETLHFGLEKSSTGENQHAFVEIKY